jgi:CRISPR type III-B/RAMP module RAMP protein Cmr1
MPTPPLSRSFALLTTAFPHGAYQSQDFNKPDLRAPSVKGQLRWWFDALFGDKPAEDRLFGGLKLPRENEKPGPQASRVLVRVHCTGQPRHIKAEFIPHKKAQGGQKNGIEPGTVFEVTLFSRRQDWSTEEQQRLNRVLDAWLLLGGVGQRANRGAGSLWPECAEHPNAASYLERVRSLLAGSRLRAAVVGPSFQSEIQLRDVAGDFLSDEAFLHVRTPFGSARPRKPSLLKLRAARIDGELRLVAIWDGRFQPSGTLSEAVSLLAQKKDIGRMLKEALPELLR